MKNTGFVLCACLLLALAACGNAKNEAPGFRVQPDVPELNDYDVILMGENHISAQIFDIELGMMEHYYSRGIRDFAFECSFGEALFFQYYFDTGDEHCFDFLTRYSGTERITQFNRERAEFYKKIYLWNSAHDEKIKIHGIDIEHDPYGVGIAATWFFILKNYDQIEGMPLFSRDGIWERAGNWYRLIEDFRTNSDRYSHISAEDSELFRKIIANIEQGLIANNRSSKISQKENRKKNAILREQFMIENFREIVKNVQGRKIFAIMGYMHTSFTGKAIYTVSESQFPWITTSEPCLANVLKNEIRIASVVMRTFNNYSKWPYFIRIKGWKLAEPHVSGYKGKWPFD